MTTWPRILYLTDTWNFCPHIILCVIVKKSIIIIAKSMGLHRVGHDWSDLAAAAAAENPMDGGAWWAAVHGVAKSPGTTERLHFDFSLSCIGDGNGNPFQCSCLENPRDGGAGWAAVYGVAQSLTQLKWLSSSRATSFSLFPFMHWRRKWRPTPVLLPGKSQGRGSPVGCHLWGRTESDTTEAT